MDENVKFAEKYAVAGKAVYTSLCTLTDAGKALDAMLANPVWAVYFDADWLKARKAAMIDATFNASPAKAQIVSLAETAKSYAADGVNLKAVIDKAQADLLIADNKRNTALADLREALKAAGFEGYSLADGKLVRAVPEAAPKEHKTTGKRDTYSWTGADGAEIGPFSNGEACVYAESNGWVPAGKFNVHGSGHYCEKGKLLALFASKGYTLKA